MLCFGYVKCLEQCLVLVENYVLLNTYKQNDKNISGGGSTFEHSQHPSCDVEWEAERRGSESEFEGGTRWESLVQDETDK